MTQIQVLLGFLKSLRFYKLGQLLVLTIYLLLGQFFENFVLHEYIVQSGFLYSWWNSLKVLSFWKWIPSYFRVFRYYICAQYLKMKKVEFLVFPKQSAEWIFFSDYIALFFSFLENWCCVLELHIYILTILFNIKY